MTFVVLSPGAAHAATDAATDRPLRIALVNNMPDSALTQTEDQFASLLRAGSAELNVELRRYTLPGVPRGDGVLGYLAENYFPIESLWSAPPDALIVTGSDPREPELTDEPYWDELVALLEWSVRHTASTIASCLSAHAVLFSTDGVPRRRLPTKCSGVYDQDVRVDHHLTRGLPAHIRVPHSRHNDVDIREIAAHGYEPVISSAEVGWTVAQKMVGSCLLVLMQGHPEYDPITLLLEYRRDVRRYLLAERPVYPPVPAGYLSAASQQSMLEFRDRALAAIGSTSELVPLFPFDEARSQLSCPWRSPAEQLYANWLSTVSTASSLSTVSSVARTLRVPEVVDAG
jgi:homoserine O-succinyltransferase